MIAAVLVLVAGGVLALVAGRSARAACLMGPLSVLGGSGLALVEAIRTLASGQIVSVRIPWHVPLGSFNMLMDPLAAWFVVPMAVVGSLAAVYGSEYLQAHRGHRNLGVSWFLFNVLLASMLLVVVARNGMFFLVAWEIMSVSSFFLVMFDGQEESVRRAGWTYLVATHIGTAFLLATFVLLGRSSGTLDLDRCHVGPELAGVIFVLAIVGFGTKAGFVPLHVWLPEAHPAAPSHVSAVMSGLMIKTGIYGLLRVLTLLGVPPAWWGWTLLGVGAVTGIGGVLLALAQQDLKRLLAYSSVENMGILTIGLGLGLLGISYRQPMLAALGLTGALVHVVNHAVFKSLLFLGAGAILHATGTRQIDRMGGLLKRMPGTGLSFLIGAAAICGLPPLNGFVGEVLIYVAAFSGMAQAGLPPGPPRLLLGTLAVGSLALIGGLAAACFARAAGIALLGEPRSTEAADARDPGWAMRWPMGVLAAACGVIALLSPGIPRVMLAVLPTLVPAELWPGVQDSLASARGPLWMVCGGSLIVFGLVLFLAAVRRLLLSGRPVEHRVTWDCGYVAPTPRMQYTASSFTWPLVYLFRMLLRPNVDIRAPQGLFPGRTAIHTDTPDPFREGLYRPLFLAVAWLVARLRWLQQGRIQLYVLYIALTLLALLVWKLGKQ
jgi:formate hydrogenlyase subunit 3/multisubunit Na+/H+ antiporter MnhD subunit